jgi:hypothetical protein
MQEEKDDDKLEYFGCRYEPEQMRFIEDLGKRRILGHNKSSVMRAVVAYALQHMAEADYIQKVRAMKDAARKS